MAIVARYPLDRQVVAPGTKAAFVIHPSKADLRVLAASRMAAFTFNDGFAFEFGKVGRNIKDARHVPSFIPFPSTKEEGGGTRGELTLPVLITN